LFRQNLPPDIQCTNAVIPAPGLHSCTGCPFTIVAPTVPAVPDTPEADAEVPDVVMLFVCAVAGTTASRGALSSPATTMVTGAVTAVPALVPHTTL
jgi:hypothetical protein